MPLHYVLAQDAKPGSQLLLIPEILNGFELSINKLEENTNASNKIISGLQKTNSSMSATIETQQRELDQASASFQNYQREARERFNGYEDTLQSLETSLTALSRENREKDDKILRLTEANSKQAKAIFIMGGMLGLMVIAAAAFLVVKIKSGALFGLAKKTL
jgi:predicted RNase H-like nuclease (RuvC/YqgF family)